MKAIFIAFAALLAAPAFSHGENIPGPHDGYIKMPGAFHTELVPDRSDVVNVYLLDLSFKNPLVKNSKVDGKLRTKDGVEIIFPCAAEQNFFQCKLPGSLNSYAGGQIILMAERDGQKSVPAVYPIPLKRGS